MILNAKQTTVAYRCPHCGAGVLSAVGLFSLNADMIKLKCDCGKSEMTVTSRHDGKFDLTVPCMFCPTPHRFTVTPTLFFDKDLFCLPCPYTGFNIALTGEVNHVKAELARTELELMDLMEKSGMENFDRFHDDEEALSDPQIQDIVMFVINDMDAEGKIYCRCPRDSADRHYDAEITPDGILVTCRGCGAKRLIPTDSRLGAHAFLTADSLDLE